MGSVQRNLELGEYRNFPNDNESHNISNIEEFINDLEIEYNKEKLLST